MVRHYGHFIAVHSESTCLHYCPVGRPDNGVSSSAALSLLITTLVSGAGISASPLPSIQNTRPFSVYLYPGVPFAEWICS